jgi:putative addiction module CopG family antidote
MQLNLPPDLEAIVDEAVKSGRYATPLDAVRAALRLLDEEEVHFRALKREIEIGANSPMIEQPLDELMEDIKRRGRVELAARRAAE